MTAKTYFQGYADSLIQSPDFISFSRLVYKIVGHNAPAAMILERIAYWHGTSAKTGKVRLNVEHDGKLWLAKTYAEWEQECCVNASTARKALDRLEKLGLIETTIGKFSGNNCLFIRAIPEKFEYLSNMDALPVQNGHIVPVQNGHFHIQESTKEQLKDSATPNGIAATPPPPTQKPKRERKLKNTPKLLVNMNNQELNLVPPDDLSPEQFTEWKKQKPIWSLFEFFLIWNETEGWDNRTVEHYRDTAHPDDYEIICRGIQNMGRWLQTFATRPNTPTIDPAFLSAFTDWYEATVVNTLPEQERKYPTTKQGFTKNLGKYLTWLSQLAKEPTL